MAEKGVFLMSQKEVRRAGLIEQILERKLTQQKVAEMLDLSDRQVRRLVKVVRKEGLEGLIHKNRGMEGNRGLCKRIRKKVLKIYAKKYHDFGPTLASEKLLELDKIRVDHDTMRRWLLEEGIKYEWQRRKRPHRKWRERKECFGEMVQMDGSHHDWLEGRGPELVLMGYVDDATGEKYAKFYLYEGTVPAMGSFKGYAEEYGVPQSVYLDKHSTYKTTRHQTIFEELKDEQALTQFERAMKELGVRVIHAHSAPAKGRVEKFFKTMQDRLIKEMRLANIKTLEEANKFLAKFLAKYNKRFRVAAKNPTNVHRKCPSKNILDSILCIKEQRTLRKDSTVYYESRVFLITNRITRRARYVEVEERLDGSIRIKYKGRYLNYKEVEPSIRVNQEEVVCKKNAVKKKKRKNSKAAKNHPWRRHSPEHQLDSCDYESVKRERVLSGV